MRGRVRFAIAGLAAAFITASACTSSAPLTPAATTPPGSNAGTLNATAPVPVSPVSNQQVVKGPTLVANPAVATFGGQVAFQYRFQVFDASNTLVQDSGLVAAPTFTVTAALAPGATYTWRVRAELNGSVGPWSIPGSFVAPQIVGVASAIAAQENIVLWPGAQPPGTTGQATLGDNWAPATQYWAPGGVYFQSPTAEMLRLFDLIDRGFDPQAAINWMNGNGYPTAAQWYPPPEKAVIGIQYVYLACTPVTSYPNCKWDVVVKTE